MKKEIIRDEIKWLLEAINEQFDAIQRHGEKIPQIEFDILMDNVRKFYSDMHILQRMNAPVPIPEKKFPPPEPSAPPSPEPPSVFQEPQAQVTTPSNTPPFRPVKAPVSGDHANAAKKAVKSNEIDLFGTEEPVFSIRLKEARELGHPRIPSDRIENLRTAITINDKFMFINELFDGNLREYNETIETLNGFITLDQAADFLDLMRKKNFWDSGSDAFKKLKELVERRY